jgi:hypothetical protein
MRPFHALNSLDFGYEKDSPLSGYDYSPGPGADKPGCILLTSHCHGVWAWATGVAIGASVGFAGAWCGCQAGSALGGCCRWGLEPPALKNSRTMAQAP